MITLCPLCKKKVHRHSCMFTSEVVEEREVKKMLDQAFPRLCLCDTVSGLEISP